MPQISLGNIYQSGGKTVVGGSQSQLDTESIVKALTDAKRLPAVRLEDRNKELDTKISSYNKLSSLLTRFKSAADVLRNPPGVQNASQNIFEYRTATLTSTGSNPASNYLAMTVEPGAANQNFTINEIEALALETKQRSSSFMVADTTTASVVAAAGTATAGQFQAGTFELRNVKGGDPVDITLNENDSLSAVVNKFNAVKDSTGIQATILKVGTGEYKIAFTATATGETYGFDLESTGTVLSDPANALGQVSFGTTQFAQNARLTVDGIEIERESNAIDDAIDGITFTIKQTMTDGTAINAVVQPDTEIVGNAITQFVDVYNEFRLFAAKQQEIGDDGLPTDEAVLANEQLMRSMIDQVASEVTRVVAGITGGNPQRLADIGISFQNFEGDEDNVPTKNIMTVDTDKLNSALSANFQGVRNLFEFNLSADNPSLSVFSRTNQLSVADFTVFRDGSTYKARYVDSNGATQEVAFTSAPIAGSNGVSLTGQKGTVFEGLTMLYTGDVTGTFNEIKATISQGFGDRLFNLMDNITNATSGTLTKVLEGLDAQITKNEGEIDKIDARVETYREQLINQYAALESALTQANQLLALLDAQAAARENG